MLCLNSLTTESTACGPFAIFLGDRIENINLEPENLY